MVTEEFEVQVQREPGDWVRIGVALTMKAARDAVGRALARGRRRVRIVRVAVSTRVMAEFAAPTKEPKP